MNYSSSTINLVMGLLFSFLGVILIALPLTSNASETFISFLSGWFTLFLLGGFFIFAGYLFLKNIKSSQNSYKIKTKMADISIDEKVIHKTLERYFNEFPHKKGITCTTKLIKNELILEVTVPFIPKEGRNKILSQIKQETTEFLYKSFRYSNEILYCIRFLDPTAPPTLDTEPRKIEYAEPDSREDL